MVVGLLALLDAMGATLNSAGQIGIAPLSCESFPAAHLPTDRNKHTACA